MSSFLVRGFVFLLLAAFFDLHVLFVVFLTVIAFTHASYSFTTWFKWMVSQDFIAMTRFMHPLFLLIARFTDKQHAKLVEYLLAKNRILRSKLPRRIEVAPAERANLVKIGKPLASGL
jgi:hypothetical protein